MEWIQQNLMLVAVPLGIVAALAAAIKFLPGYLENKAMAALEYLFEKGDAADDAWLCATIKWAEAKYGPRTGAMKAAAVTDKIIGLLPVQYRIFITGKVSARAVELFQQCFDRLEAAALAQADKHKH